MIATVSVLVGSNSDLTVMVVVPAVSPIITPEAETLATAETDEVYDTVSGAKYSVSTIVESDKVCPILIVAEAGVTVTEATAGVPGTNAFAFAKGDTLNVFQRCNQ